MKKKVKKMTLLADVTMSSEMSVERSPKKLSACQDLSEAPNVRAGDLDPLMAAKQKDKVAWWAAPSHTAGVASVTRCPVCIAYVLKNYLSVHKVGCK